MYTQQARTWYIHSSTMQVPRGRGEKSDRMLTNNEDEVFGMGCITKETGTRLDDVQSQFEEIGA